MVRHRRIFDFRATQGWYPWFGQKSDSPNYSRMQAIFSWFASDRRLSCDSVRRRTFGSGRSAVQGLRPVIPRYGAWALLGEHNLPDRGQISAAKGHISQPCKQNTFKSTSIADSFRDCKQDNSSISSTLAKIMHTSSSIANILGTLLTAAQFHSISS